MKKSLIRLQGLIWISCMLSIVMPLSYASSWEKTNHVREVQGVSIPVLGAVSNEFQLEQFDSLVMLGSQPKSMVFVFVSNSKRAPGLEQMLLQMEEADNKKYGPHSYRPRWDRLIPREAKKAEIRLKTQTLPAAKVQGLPGDGKRQLKGMVTDLDIQRRTVTVMYLSYDFDERKFSDYLSSIIAANPSDGSGFVP